MHLSRPVLLAAAAAVALLLGPWLARTVVRLATRDDAARSRLAGLAVRAGAG